jgi:hypothetical protein
MNTGGKSFHSPYVAKIRMTEKVTVEMVPESTGRRERIVLTRKTNDRRIYPAEGEKTTSSFLVTNCSATDSDLSFCFLKKKNERNDELQVPLYQVADTELYVNVIIPS